MALPEMSLTWELYFEIMHFIPNKLALGQVNKTAYKALVYYKKMYPKTIEIFRYHDLPETYISIIKFKNSLIPNTYFAYWKLAYSFSLPLAPSKSAIFDAREYASGNFGLVHTNDQGVPIKNIVCIVYELNDSSCDEYHIDKGFYTNGIFVRKYVKDGDTIHIDFNDNKKVVYCPKLFESCYKNYIVGTKLENVIGPIFLKKMNMFHQKINDNARM